MQPAPEILSPSPGTLEEKKADKRRRILAAALKLFAARGYHGTAVPLVAEEAGVGAGTIYRYFPSKEALVNEVFREAKRHLGEHLLEDFDLKASPRKMFHDFWWRLVSFAREHPVSFAFLELQDHIPYLDKESKGLETGILAPIWVALADARAKKFLKPLEPQVAMAMGWGALVGLIKAERMGYFRLTKKHFEEAEQAVWDAFAAARGE